MIVVDLFAGCGGMSLGFQKSKFKVVSAYDFWDAAVSCYELNFSHQIFTTDLSKTNKAVKHISQWNANMIIGGPPCQDFSHAGKRNEGKQANLTTMYANIISKIRPEWFVMENVARTRQSRTYQKACSVFSKAGYGLTEIVLDASLCGIPQKRKRFFSIGHMYSEDGFLDTFIDSKMSDEPCSIRECLGEEFGIEYYYRHPRNYSRRGIFSIDEPSPTIRGVNRPIPKGYPGHHLDPVPVTPDLRPLTTLERARLQTFPKNFKWIGTKTDLEQLIGNAVPVDLASFVADAIQDYIRAGKAKAVA